MRPAYKNTLIFAGGGISLGCGMLLCQKIADPSLAILWAFACLLLGGLVGLIFGLPRGVKQVKQDNFDQKNKFEDNNNLIEVSDWLTKVIVGVGLVQLRGIPAFIDRVASKVGRGIVKEGGYNSLNLEAANSLSMSSLVYFTIFGFILAYVLSRAVLLDMFEGSDSLNKSGE